MRPCTFVAALLLALTSVGLASADSRPSDRATSSPVGRSAVGVSSDRAALVPGLTVPNPSAVLSRGVDTLWFFDADFEDEYGDNQYWNGFDNTGHQACISFWSSDTVRTPLSRPYLGDYAWWCGIYAAGNDCWLQNRGYGNNWTCIMERDFPEVNEHTNPGDQLQLEWDQRYAMEKDYDYGYVEISTTGGASWTTLAAYTNSGYAGQPGTPMNWGGANGHPILDMDAYAGAPTLRLRFRFVSDETGSSYDSSANGYRDGAWEIDNIKWSGGTPLTQFWLDDSEPGAPFPNWRLPISPAYDQVGVEFARYNYPWDLDEGGGEYCGQPPNDSYVWAAVHPATQEMVNDQDSWLLSPEIHPPEEGPLVVYWRGYTDCPYGANDYFDLYARTDTLYECHALPMDFIDPEAGAWYGERYWFSDTSLLGEQFSTGEWLRLAWRLGNYEPLANPDDHGRGLFIDRVRIGVVSGLAAGSPTQLFQDWFDHELSRAATDTAIVRFYSPDGIASVDLVVPGASLRVPAVPGGPSNLDYMVGMPPGLLAPGAEHLYYFEATDSLGKVGVCPGGAPEVCFEFSVLPRGGDVLLVDGAGHVAPRQGAGLAHDVQYYYEEALEILGHTWDRYDVPATHHGRPNVWDGPDLAGLDNYDTVFWVTGDNDYWPMPTENDALALESWLEAEPLGDGRDLLLAGNRLSAAYDTTLLHLLSEYGGVTCAPEFDPWDVELRGTGSWEFETGKLARCPDDLEYDVVRPRPAATGTEIVADYAVYTGAGWDTLPAAVLRTDPTIGYQVTTLGFGIEYVGEGPERDGLGGIASRIGFLASALEAMAVEPSNPGTGVPESVAAAAVSLPHPNPFNPATTVEYNVGTAGRALVQVFDLSGRLVRTLLDEDVPAGAAGRLVWNGADDRGAPCASGVYFCKVTAPGLDASRKLVLLK